MSAESWSLKGRTIRTVGFSFGAGIGCGSSTLEAINDLTVEFIRCCGYFSREKTAIRRPHSSEKYGQHDDKRYARSSMVKQDKNVVSDTEKRSAKIFGMKIRPKVFGKWKKNSLVISNRFKFS